MPTGNQTVVQSGCTPEQRTDERASALLFVSWDPGFNSRAGPPDVLQKQETAMDDPKPPPDEDEDEDDEEEEEEDDEDED